MAVPGAGKAPQSRCQRLLLDSRRPDRRAGPHGRTNGDDGVAAAPAATSRRGRGHRLGGGRDAVGDRVPSGLQGLHGRVRHWRDPVGGDRRDRNPRAVSHGCPRVLPGRLRGRDGERPPGLGGGGRRPRESRSGPGAHPRLGLHLPRRHVVLADQRSGPRQVARPALRPAWPGDLRGRPHGHGRVPAQAPHRRTPVVQHGVHARGALRALAQGR